MEKYIHLLCSKCFRIYKNFAKIETKSKAENMRVALCPHCVIKNIANACGPKTQNVLAL